MKTNFTSSEIETLVKTLGSKFIVNMNKAGNMKVINPAEPNSISYWRSDSKHGFWVLYKHANGNFIWRRHDGYGYCYPLNMKGRKFQGTVRRVRNEETGRFEYWGYRPFQINNAEFTSFDEALNYFVKYLFRVPFSRAYAKITAKVHLFNNICKFFYEKTPTLYENAV